MKTGGIAQGVTEGEQKRGGERTGERRPKGARKEDKIRCSADKREDAGQGLVDGQGMGRSDGTEGRPEGQRRASTWVRGRGGFAQQINFAGGWLYLANAFFYFPVYFYILFY